MKNHLFIFCALSASLFFAGCNSTASFENNQATCRNGQLDDGEACDPTAGDGNIFPAGVSCATYEYNSGSLNCTDECVIDKSGCTNVDGCDPILNDGCSVAGDTCYFDANDQSVSCQWQSGNGQAGAACDLPWTDCTPSLTCLEGICTELCYVGNLCPDGVAMCEPTGWPLSLGVCPLPATSCDPVLNQGCDTGLGCYILDYSDSVGCTNEGPVQRGDSCGGNTDCVAKNVCVTVTDPALSVCTELCKDTFYCAMPATCAFFESGPAGICVDQFPCSPKISGECGSGLECYIVNSLGHTACLVPGEFGENESCCLFNRCQAGLYCAMNDDNLCHRVCSSSADCASGNCNIQASWAGGTLGYCMQF